VLILIEQASRLLAISKRYIRCRRATLRAIYPNIIAISSPKVQADYYTLIAILLSHPRFPSTCNTLPFSPWPLWWPARTPTSCTTGTDHNVLGKDCSSPTVRPRPTSATWVSHGRFAETPLIILQPMIPDTNANNAASVTVKPDPQDNDASCAFNLLISGYRTRSMLTSVVVLWFYKPKDCTQNPVLNTVEKNLMSMPLQECIDFEEFGANSWKINGPFPS